MCKTDQKCPIFRPESLKVPESSRIDQKVTKSGESDGIDGFAQSGDSLGVLPGFLAVLARLFPSFRPESVFPRVKTLPQSVILRVFAGGVVTK